MHPCLVGVFEGASKSREVKNRCQSVSLCVFHATLECTARTHAFPNGSSSIPICTNMIMNQGWAPAPAIHPLYSPFLSLPELFSLGACFVTVYVSPGRSLLPAIPSASTLDQHHPQICDSLPIEKTCLPPCMEPIWTFPHRPCPPIMNVEGLVRCGDTFTILYYVRAISPPARFGPTSPNALRLSVEETFALRLPAFAPSFRVRSPHSVPQTRDSHADTHLPVGMEVLSRW